MDLCLRRTRYYQGKSGDSPRSVQGITSPSGRGCSHWRGVGRTLGPSLRAAGEGLRDFPDRDPVGLYFETFGVQKIPKMPKKQIEAY